MNVPSVTTQHPLSSANIVTLIVQIALIVQQIAQYALKVHGSKTQQLEIQYVLYNVGLDIS